MYLFKLYVTFMTGNGCCTKSWIILNFQFGLHDCFGLWEVTGRPGVNPRRHWQNVQTPQKGCVNPGLCHPQ